MGLGEGTGRGVREDVTGFGDGTGRDRIRGNVGLGWDRIRRGSGPSRFRGWGQSRRSWPMDSLGTFERYKRDLLPSW